MRKTEVGDTLRSIITQALDQTWDVEAEEKRKAKVEEMRGQIRERFRELTKNWKSAPLS
jgi:uncharacterized protein YdhG (YjbR/CyaY superfamily)